MISPTLGSEETVVVILLNCDKGPAALGCAFLGRRLAWLPGHLSLRQGGVSYALGVGQSKSFACKPCKELRTLVTPSPWPPFPSPSSKPKTTLLLQECLMCCGFQKPHKLFESQGNDQQQGSQVKLIENAKVCPDLIVRVPQCPR